MCCLCLSCRSLIVNRRLSIIDRLRDLSNKRVNLFSYRSLLQMIHLLCEFNYAWHFIEISI